MDPHPTCASVCLRNKIFPPYPCGVTSSDPGLNPSYVSAVYSSGFKWINLSLISVPLCLFFQTYRLKEKTGLMGVISSFWMKINQPFQPGVPEPQDPRTRVLSQPFSRDKLHLWVPALAHNQTIIQIWKTTCCHNCFSFILQIWYKVKKQLVQQCNTRSNCEYRTQKLKLCHLITIVSFQKHKGRHFEWSIFLPVQLQGLGTGAFKLQKWEKSTIKVS